MKSQVRPARVCQVASPQRLLFFLHSSVFDQYGGIEYYLEDILENSSAIMGPEQVSALVACRSKVEVSRPYSIHFIQLSNRPLFRKIENRFSARFFETALREIRRFKPTLLINSHVSLGPMAYTLSKLSGIPFVTIVYGVDCWGNLWPQDEWCLRRTDGIISISQWTKTILTERGYEKKKIQIIHPKMANEFETLPSSQADRPSAGTLKRPFTLLTIARLDAREQYKGQDHVMEALSLLRQRKPSLKIRYLLQGEGSDKGRLKALCRSLALEDIVVFREGVKSRANLERLYSETDVFIMPSRFGRWAKAWRGEGFGIVYVEAAAFAVPSIAYRCGGATDIILDQKTGLLVEPENIPRLSEAIESMASQPQWTKELGQNARKLAAERFTTLPFQQQIKHSLTEFQTLNAFP